MKHHHSHIALLVVAISVTFFVYALYGYMYHTVDTLLVHALAGREDVKKEQIHKDQGKSLATTYQATVQDRAKLATFFVADNDKVLYIETIEALGEHAGSTVSLSSIVADDLATSPVGTQGHITIHVDVQGTWSSVMRTLILAENLPYKVVVSNVHLDTTGTLDSRESKQEWRLSFVLDTISVRNPN